MYFLWFEGPWESILSPFWLHFRGPEAPWDSFWLHFGAPALKSGIWGLEGGPGASKEGPGAPKGAIFEHFGSILSAKMETKLIQKHN